MTGSASTSTPLPTLLLADFHAAIRGTGDADPYEVLDAILGDVLDSVRLAVSDLPVMGTASEEAERKRQCVAEVEDYIANHYGDACPAEERQFLVEWTMPFAATDVVDAALQARGVQQDPASIATVFHVTLPGGKRARVDVEDPANPIVKYEED